LDQYPVWKEKKFAAVPFVITAASVHEDELHNGCSCLVFSGEFE